MVSITGCVISDGTTTARLWPLITVPLDAVSTSLQLTMVPTPSNGQLYFEAGFVKNSDNQFIQTGSGTGPALNAGYQPPQSPGADVAGQFSLYGYSPTDYSFEYRWWPVGSNGVGITSGSPLCVIKAVVTDPVISGASAVTIPESTTALGSYGASRSVTWSLLDYYDPDLFQFNPSGTTGALSFVLPSTLSNSNSFVFIRATDTAGNVFEKKVDVTVLPLSQMPPVISGLGSVSITAPATSVGSYTANKSVIWSVTGGAHQNLFQINSSGALSFKNSSTAGTYTVIVTATDTNNNTTTRTITVTVSAAGGGEPSTSSGFIPQKQHVSTVDTTPAPGQTVAMFGSYFGGVTEVFVGGIKAEIISKTDNRINIRMPQGLTGALDVELKSPLGTLLLPKHFTIGKLPAAGTNKKTLVVGGFAPNSRKLTASMQARIDRWLDRNSAMTNLTCTSFTSLPRRTTDVELSTNRGTTACNYAKRQRPEVKTSVSQGVEDPRPGSNVRRVMLVLTP